jgi:hypothetical protein
MDAQQNDERVFAPPTYSQKIFESHNGNYKLLLEVHNFNGYVRVGIVKQVYCEEVADYVHAKKGHCYFHADVCEALNKFLPTAKSEADRLEKQVNGHFKQGGYAGKGPSRFVPAKSAQRRAYGNVAPLTFAELAASTNHDGSNTASEHQSRGKRRADDYKTGGKEDEACSVEQGSPKKLNIEDASEETIVAKKVQGVERANVFRRH